MALEKERYNDLCFLFSSMNHCMYVCMYVCMCFKSFFPNYKKEVCFDQCIKLSIS